MEHCPRHLSVEAKEGTCAVLHHRKVRLIRCTCNSSDPRPPSSGPEERDCTYCLD